MKLHFYFLFSMFLLFSFSLSAQDKIKADDKPVPRMKTQVFIKKSEPVTAESLPKHPASHQLSTSIQDASQTRQLTPPTPDEMINSYQRKLDSLSEEYRSQNPEMVELLQNLILEQKTKKENPPMKSENH